MVQITNCNPPYHPNSNRYLYVTSDISCLPQQTGISIFTTSHPTQPTFSRCVKMAVPAFLGLVEQVHGCNRIGRPPSTCQQHIWVCNISCMLPSPPFIHPVGGSGRSLLHESVEEFGAAGCFTSCGSLRDLIHQLVVL